jgi:uncharacterized protein
LNVSKSVQRVLHALAQGGHITYEKDDRGKIIEVLCRNRDGWVLSDCTLAIFQ